MSLDSFMEWALASSLLVSSIVGIVALSRYFGGRWRSELEAANITIARIEATLIEKDHLLEAKDEQMAGMSARLAKLDEERKQWGGPRVYEALVLQQQENAQAFRQLGELLVKHQTEMVDEIARVGDRVVRCMNGEGKR